MIVCSCNVLTDKAVRRAIEADTARTPGQVYGCLGCSPQCGRCARTIKKMMTEALNGASVALGEADEALNEVAEAACGPNCKCHPQTA